LFERSHPGAVAKRTNVEEEEESDSSENDMLEEKMMEYSSEDDGNLEEQTNFMFDSQRLKTIASLIPNDIKLKSPSLRLTSYLASKGYNIGTSHAFKDTNGDVKNKEEDRRDRLGSDDNSVSLSNINNYLDERSADSSINLGSPNRSLHFNPENAERKVKNLATHTPSSEKFTELLMQLENDNSREKILPNYIDQLVSLFKDCCKSYLSLNNASENERKGEMEEEDNVEPIKTFDLTGSLVTKPTQALDTKLATPVKLFKGGFDLRQRVLSETNQMLALFIHSNPPSKKRMDYNGKALLSIAENDRLFIYNKNQLLENRLPSTKKESLPALSLKSFDSKASIASSPFDKEKAFAKYKAGHPILSACFNRAFPNKIALVGIETITFCLIEKNGECIENEILMLQGDADYILKAMWLPNQKVKISLLLRI